MADVSIADLNKTLKDENTKKLKADREEAAKQWLTVLIKSIQKNKKDVHNFINQRGMFMTSMLSKVLEKIYHNRNQTKLNQRISKYQWGSRKKRSIIFNISLSPFSS